MPLIFAVIQKNTSYQIRFYYPSFQQAGEQGARGEKKSENF
jgi:hypothetical protein